MKSTYSRPALRTTLLGSLALLLLLVLAACGDTPTNTPAPTTAAATTVAPTTVPATTAAPTTAPTTAPATTAAATTTAATTAPATTAAATVAATTVANAPTRTSGPVANISPRPTATRAPTVSPATPRAAPAPTMAQPTAASGPPPTVAPRPAPDPLLKADPLLIDLFETYTKATGSADEKLEAARDFAYDIEAIIDEDADEVSIELEVGNKTDVTPISDKVQKMGGFVDDTYEVGNKTYILIAVPLEILMTYTNASNNFLRELAVTSGVDLINLPEESTTEELKNLPATLDALKTLSQSAKNQAVQTTGAAKWHAAGFKGKGATIGIVDSGYKYHQQFRGTVLPADFEVEDFSKKLLQEDSIEKGVHGTAVSEIIYSMAPEAKIYATSIAGTDAESIAAIDYLVSKKVDIISISMGNNSNPEDGTSAVSKKIQEVHNATGIMFFLASGNEGTEHYAGYFSPNSKNFHQWIPGVDRMALGVPGVAVDVNTTIILRWDQWLNGDVNPNAADFDLVIEDDAGQVVGTIDGDQRVRPPLEFARGLKIPSGKLAYLKVKLKDGTPPPTQPVRLHIFVTGGLTPQFFTPMMTVGTSADSRGAVAVGSVDPPDGSDIASYSSQGPLSDGRVKPDISAPGGVGSASYEQEGGKSFPGTSAATPQLSGLAALIKAASPALSGAEVIQVLLENARMPAGLPVPNSTYGYGIADLNNLTPGPQKPKGNLPPAPTVAPNAPIAPLLISLGYPTPVPSGP